MVAGAPWRWSADSVARVRRAALVLAAALLQARYGSAPFVKLFGDWGLAGGRQPREIHLFSNGQRTTLTLNGREIAALAGGEHQVLQVPFASAAIPLVVTVPSYVTATFFSLTPNPCPATLMVVPDEPLRGSTAI